MSLIVQEYEGLKDDLAKTQAEYKRLQDEYAGKIKDYAGQSKQLEQLQNSKVTLEAKLKELQAQQSGCQSTADLLEKARKDKASIESRFKELESRQSGYQTQNQQLTDSLKQLSLLIEEKDKAVRELKRAQTERENQLKDLLLKQEELLKQKSADELILKDYELKKKALEQAQKDTDALTLRLNALEAQQAGWRGQGEQLSSSVQQLSLSVQEKDRLLQE